MREIKPGDIITVSAGVDWPDERWVAPNHEVARRWADEITGRGGRAEIVSDWRTIVVNVKIPASMRGGTQAP